MTNAEYRDFLVKIEQQFPAFAEWLKRPGHHWKELIQTYYEGLQDEKVTFAESLDVLKGWANGTIEGAPVGFENQRFLANLLSAIRENRTAKRAKESSQKINRDILGDCQDLPIRSKVPNPCCYPGGLLAQFQRELDARRPKELATV